MTALSRSPQTPHRNDAAAPDTRQQRPEQDPAAIVTPDEARQARPEGIWKILLASTLMVVLGFLIVSFFFY